MYICMYVYCVCTHIYVIYVYIHITDIINNPGTASLRSVCMYASNQKKNYFTREACPYSPLVTDLSFFFENATDFYFFVKNSVSFSQIYPIFFKNKSFTPNCNGLNCQ